MIDKFVRVFVHNPDGCRGNSVQGYAVAQWLDDWHAHQARPTGIDFL